MSDQENSQKKYYVDFRNVIIIFLILFCVWLFFNPFTNSKIKELQSDIDQKEKEIKDIQNDRDTLDKKIKKIDINLESYKKLAKLRRDTIDYYRRLSQIKESEIKDLKDGLDLYNQMIKMREKEIDDLIKNPIVLPKNKIVEKSSEKFK